MTSSKAPGSGTAGLAGGAGPEQNLHLDHDAAREALGTADPSSRLDQARDAVTRAAGQAREAIGQARDAVGQARESVAGAVDDARDRARAFYDDTRDSVRDAYGAGTERFYDMRDRGYQAASTGRDSVERYVAENPLLVGVVGLAAGLLLGALLPRTRQEDQTIGRWADDARDQGVRYARDVTQRGRQFVDATMADIGNHVRDDMRDEPRTTATATGQRVGPSGRYQNH